MSITIKISCPAHPGYRAKRAPAADCSPCWQMYYIVRNNGGVIDRRLKVERVELPDDCPNCGGSAPA